MAATGSCSASTATRTSTREWWTRRREVRPRSRSPRRPRTGRSPGSVRFSKANETNRALTPVRKSWSVPDLAAVSQAGRNAVDGEVDRAQQARVAAAGAVAAQQLDLQVVERVEVGKAVADRARQGRVVGEQLGMPGDRREPAARALPLLRDAAEDFAAQPFVRDQ